MCFVISVFCLTDFLFDRFGVYFVLVLVFGLSFARLFLC